MHHRDNRQKEPVPCKQRSRREGSSFNQEPGRYLSLAQRLTKKILAGRLGLQLGQTQAVSLGACCQCVSHSHLPLQNRQRFIYCSTFPASNDTYLSFPGSSLEQEPCLHFPLPLNKGDIADGPMVGLHFLLPA